PQALRHRPARRLRPGGRAGDAASDRHDEHPRCDSVPAHAEARRVLAPLVITLRGLCPKKVSGTVRIVVLPAAYTMHRVPATFFGQSPLRVMNLRLGWRGRR